MRELGQGTGNRGKNAQASIFADLRPPNSYLLLFPVPCSLSPLAPLAMLSFAAYDDPWGMKGQQTEQGRGPACKQAADVNGQERRGIRATSSVFAPSPTHYVGHERRMSSTSTKSGFALTVAR